MAYLASDIIAQFELQVSDMTELATSEELIILNRVRRKINRRQWEANRKSFSGMQSTTVPYISLPTDFYTLAPNRNINGPDYYAESTGIFIGTNGSYVTVVPYADRTQYVNSTGYAYIDQINSRLVFPAQPASAQTVQFDYYAMPADLLIGDSDWITNNFPEALVYGMATEDFILQLSDKAKSYAPENAAKMRDEVSEIASWNMQFLGNLT